MTRLPDPFHEIRVLDVRDVPGANFWSRRPVTRLDLHPGRFDEVSSAEVPGFTERLLEVLPGLTAHECSIGEPGGFVTRLRRGTYTPHIVEHVALELQVEVGHDVGFGRARGGDRDGEYTVVVERLHPEVGRAALLAAVEVVRRLLAGAPVKRDCLLSLVRPAASRPPEAGFGRRDAGLVVVGGAVAVARHAAGASVPDDAFLIDYPALLQRGLLVEGAVAGVVLDLDPAGLPPRYREPDRVRTLASIVGDAVRPGGAVLIPAGQGRLAATLRDAGRWPMVPAFDLTRPDAIELARRLKARKAAARAG
jgi:hypothetical protein